MKTAHQEIRPTELPNRRKPAQGVHINSNQPTIVFVTVCTKDRKPWLACDEAHRLLMDVWRRAEAWLVGNYVLMPDHLHLFAAPRWVGGSAGDSPCRNGSAGASPYPENVTPNDGRATLQRSRVSAEDGSASPYQNQKPFITIERWITFWKSQFSKSHSHADWIWQTSAFHHRLRQAESYSQKWLYVQENPVRAGLAKEIGQWPYQGTIHELRW